MATLLLELMQKFVKAKLFYQKKKNFESLCNFAKLDGTNPENIRPSKKIDIGRKTVSFLMKNNIAEDDVLKFRNFCKTSL